MGFTDAKRLVLACLRSGHYEFAIREHISEKNLFATGELSAEDVTRMIGRCLGTQYTTQPLSEDPATLKHILKPMVEGQQWFIRFYFVQARPHERAVFISVHQSTH